MTDMMEKVVEAVKLIGDDSKDKPLPAIGRVACPKCQGPLFYRISGPRSMKAMCETRDCLMVMA